MKIFNTLLAIVRLLLFSLVTIIIYGLLLITNLFYKKRDKKIQRGIIYRRFIIRILHYILGTKIIVYGNEPKISGLIVSNHRSYFDPLVILKNILAYPIAKKEVEFWPLIGSVCKTTGVIFVRRDNKSSRLETLDKINIVLEKGFSILNSPEGTTHIEPVTIDFKPGAFVMAAQLGVPVIPVAIDYKNLSDAWIGDDTFIPHFLRCFGKWRTEIKVSFLEPVFSNNADELITSSKKQIDKELLRFRKEWEAA
ncbi:lysophospholipid acyltransferase family protein [Lutibacter sp.]|uniref:lysophospholipid acyltransferase family protein n=1 Tax=Lutibacter sp. TaxID=1925666 RepID=UPI0025BD6A08|nr:lysophospholipid acyltransferase family protein [Lutibacter sp.]MCF6168750.1 1-acyl-sn-glycerol-3-phosphate acyltransferase [Lutibacter sp.]